MNNFYNSGLYSEPFFRKHKNLNFRLHSSVVEAMLESDYELFLKHYSAGLDCQNEDELQEEIISLFVENINLYATYFEPLIFDKEIALECGLTPFKYSELNLLALSGCSMDFSPRLDAYQVFYAVNTKYYILHQKMRIFYTKNMRGYKSSAKTQK